MPLSDRCPFSLLIIFLSMMLAGSACRTSETPPEAEPEKARSLSSKGSPHILGPSREVFRIPSRSTYGPAPLTGLALSASADKLDKYSRAIGLEHEIFSFKDIVTGSAKGGYRYNWAPITAFLEGAKARGHHAILRFRDTDPELTAPGVPPDLLRRRVTALYDENIPNVPNQRKVFFPDWSNPELVKFYVGFFTRFAEKFDHDRTLATVQIGFGLWGEYHLDFPNLKQISDPTITSVATALGKIFPSKQDQLTILKTVEASLKQTPVGISIDAADENYTDFTRKEAWRKLPFGHFDDSLLATVEKEVNWRVFPNAKTALNGGEISYYNDNDQEEALSPEGPNGVSLAQEAKNRSLTYVIANGQPKYHGPDRIAAAGKLLGYSLKIEAAFVENGRTLVTVTNIGAAPVHFDLYAEIASARAPESLRGLAPGQRKSITIPGTGAPSAFRFWSPRLFDGEVIPFAGN